MKSSTLAAFASLSCLVPWVASAALPTKAPVRLEFTKRDRRLSKRGTDDAQTIRNEVQALIRKTTAKYKYTSGNVAKNTHGGKSKASPQRRSSTQTLDLSVDTYPQPYVEFDAYYYAPLQIGTPAQSVQFDFDTGSSDLWLPNTHCYNCQAGTQLFNTSASKTYTPTGRPFGISYLDGSQANGVDALEKVAIAAGSTQIATNFVLGSVNYVSGDLSNNVAPGLVGLSYPALASSGEPSLPFILAAQGKMASQFGMTLLREDNQSSIVFGGPTAPGNYQFSPLNSQSQYQIGLLGSTINGKTSSTPLNAVIDSGTSIILISSYTTVADFYSKIPGSYSNDDGSFSYPCPFSDTINTGAPQTNTLSWTFAGSGGVNNTVPMHIDDLAFYVNTDTTYPYMCIGSVMYENFDFGANGPQAIMGDSFMKSSHVLFDFGHNRVGFLPHS